MLANRQHGRSHFRCEGSHVAPSVNALAVPVMALCAAVRSPLVVFSLVVLVGYHGDQGEASNGNGLPCLYEGKLRTDRSWYGYLANITVVTTGSMLYEFSYPADKCCQNILFYSEDQMSIISARMNCWQKEYLLRPEDDQILRLTPRFAWSGCRMTHPNSVATYVCSGGRSFTSAAADDRPTTWYVAVSNCAALQGLDLKYRLEVFGHIGDCPHLLTTTIPTTTVTVPPPKITLIPKESVATQIADNKNVCVLEGVLNVTNNWYGFIANMSLAMGGGFRFRFSYPYEMQVQNVILYNEADVAKLNEKQSCWQKDGIIRTRNVPDQILDLSFRSSWNGCISKNGTGGRRTLTCVGERRYEMPRKVYMAVSNCRGINGLYLNYRLEVSGFEGDLCHSGSAPTHGRHHRQRTCALTTAICFLLTAVVSATVDLDWNVTDVRRRKGSPRVRSRSVADRRRLSDESSPRTDDRRRTSPAASDLRGADDASGSPGSSAGDGAATCQKQRHAPVQALGSHTTALLCSSKFGGSIAIICSRHSPTSSIDSCTTSETTYR